MRLDKSLLVGASVGSTKNASHPSTKSIAEIFQSSKSPSITTGTVLSSPASALP